MSLILFKNAKLLDPTKADLQDGVAVLVEGARVREVSPRPIRTSEATVATVDHIGAALRASPEQGRSPLGADPGPTAGHRLTGR
jgi:hypothetical protein